MRKLRVNELQGPGSTGAKLLGIRHRNNFNFTLSFFFFFLSKKKGSRDYPLAQLLITRYIRIE